MEYIAFDCHKRYTWAVVEDEQGRSWRKSGLSTYLEHGGSFWQAVRVPPVAMDTVATPS